MSRTPPSRPRSAPGRTTPDLRDDVVSPDSPRDSDSRQVGSDSSLEESLSRLKTKFLSSSLPSGQCEATTPSMRMSTSPLAPSEAENIRHCLEIVRNSEPGQAPGNAVATIERAMAELWARVEAGDQSYVMTNTEFAVFNFFRSRYASGRYAGVAQKATARHWNARGTARERW